MARTLLRFQDDEETDPLSALLDGNGSLQPSQQAVPPDPEPPVSQPEETPPADTQQDLPTNQPPSLHDPREHLIATMLDDRSGAQAPAAGSISVPGAKSDPELESARRNAELSALHNANFDRGGYGLGEFARDNGAALLASILDVGFNKGRGLGAIVGATANEVGKQEAARQARAKDAGEFATRIRGQKDDALQRERLDYLNRSLGVKVQGQQGTQGRAEHNWGQKEDVNSPQYQAAIAAAKLKAEAGVQGREGAKHDLVDQMAGDAAAISGARTTANTESKNETPADITAAEQARLDLQAQQLEESKRGRAVAEGQRADTERQRQTNDFNTKYGSAIETLNAAKNLQSLIGDDGDIEGVGPVVGSRFMPDALKSDKAIQEQQAFAAFQNPGFVARSGKAVTPTEAPRLETEFGNLKSTNPEVVRNAVKAIAETMRGTIKRGSVGREDIAREVLSSQHLDDVLGPALADDAPPSARDALPQPAAPKRPSARAPQAGAMSPQQWLMQNPSNMNPAPSDTTLQTMPGRPPPISAAGGPPPAPAAGGVHHVRKPDGSVVPTMKSPDELQGLPQGWSVVD